MAPKTEQVLTVRIPKSLAVRVARLAKVRGCDKSQVAREALEAAVQNDSSGAAMSFLAQATDLAGCAQAGADLSTNKKHFEGYGE